MIPVTCTKRLHFCAAHRLVGHDGLCAHLHGHNYAVDVTAERYKTLGHVDKIGCVVDFSELKKRIGSWINTNWDHTLILRDDDPLATSLSMVMCHSKSMLSRNEPRLFKLPANPTAENMALHLLNIVVPQCFGNIGTFGITAITVWETDTCCATARLST